MKRQTAWCMANECGGGEEVDRKDLARAQLACQDRTGWRRFIVTSCPSRSEEDLSGKMEFFY